MFPWILTPNCSIPTPTNPSTILSPLSPFTDRLLYIPINSHTKLSHIYSHQFLYHLVPLSPQAKDQTYKVDMATQEERVAEMEQRLVAQEDAVRAERETLEEEIRAQLTKQFEGRDRLHQEEVEGLTREWQLERQVGADYRSVGCVGCSGRVGLLNYPPEVRRGEYWGWGVFLLQYFSFVKIWYENFFFFFFSVKTIASFHEKIWKLLHFNCINMNIVG